MTIDAADRQGDWHVALVDFIRSAVAPDILKVLPDEAEGAVGWLGVITESQVEVEETIRECLSQIGLRVLSVKETCRIQDLEDLGEFDVHLFENIKKRPIDDPSVVWGTLHTYLAEGEA